MQVVSSALDCPARSAPPSFLPSFLGDLLLHPASISADTASALSACDYFCCNKISA